MYPMGATRVMGAYLVVGDDLDLHLGTARQRRDLDSRPSRKISGEVPCVDLVHGSEISEIGHEHRRLDDVLEGQLLVLKDDLDVLQYALRLGTNIRRERSIGMGGIDRNLACAKEEVAESNPVIVWSERRR